MNYDPDGAEVGLVQSKIADEYEMIIKIRKLINEQIAKMNNHKKETHTEVR